VLRQPQRLGRVLEQPSEEGAAFGERAQAQVGAVERAGAGLDPKAVQWAVQGLRILGDDAPVPLSGAARAGRQQKRRLRSGLDKGPGLIRNLVVRLRS
jgi:hypothetical protein